MPKVIDLPTATTMDSGDYFVMEESTGGTKKITNNNVLSNRAYSGSLTSSNYTTTLNALPSGANGIYQTDATTSSFFSKGDSSATGMLIIRKLNSTTYDFMLSAAAFGRPLYSGRVESFTTTPTLSVYKMTGTGV